MKKIKEVFKLLYLLKDMVLPMLLAIILGTLGHISALMIPLMTVLLILGPYNKVYMFILIGSGISRAIFRYLEQLMNHYIAFHILADIRNSVFEKLRELAPAKLESHKQGDIISALTGDIELIEVFYAHTISPIFIALFFDLFVFILMAKINKNAALITVISHIFIAILLPLYFGNKGKSLGLKYRDYVADLNSSILESISNMMGFRQYSAGDKRNKEILSMNDQLIHTQMKVKSLYAISLSISDLIIYASSLIILFLGFDLGIKVLIISFVLHISSFGPSLALSNLSLDLNQTMGSIHRLNRLFKEKPLIEDVVNGKDVSVDNLQVENLSFSYGEQMILEDLNLEIEKGEIIGIMGESGSGKSSLAKLLMRFRQASKGSIKVSSIDIEEIDSANLKQVQAYMTQDSHLFKGSIKDNITMFSEEIDKLQVIEAAKKASIHDFIVSLEHGYDTLIAELASNVSSGEKQRIALARLFYFDRPILVLDEPSSNLDSLSEAIILKSLYENRKDKIIILISHRESTMRIADRIYHMQNGKLIRLQE